MATISYSRSPYCLNTISASPTTGTTGSIYSFTTGLSINATSGAIDLSTSTTGIYTVIYTVAASGGAHCIQQQHL